MEARGIYDKARIITSKDAVHPEAAALLSKLKDYSSLTFVHCQNVGYLTAQIMISENIEKERACSIVTGALLHDIGKIKVPTEITEKPGPLTKDEYLEMMNHPRYGVEIIEKECPFLFQDKIVTDIILYHHAESAESYPKGVSFIPEYVSLVHAIDIYDAITSERPYSKPGKSAEIALCTMQNEGVNPKLIEMIKKCEIK